MITKRQQRVAGQLRQIISELIRTEAKDPRLEGVTVMDVTVDRELEVAKIYVNCLKGETARDEVMAGLDRATGFLRRELGRKIRLRTTPELRFLWDESLGEADKIEALLKSISIPDATVRTEGTDEGN